MSEKPKTILLVFIHGFQGDDTTFASFPTHFTTALSRHLASTPQPPNIKPLLYPAFATRGSLANAVERFRAWLLEKVIDAEVARGTASPTLAPGVGVVLCGHSMGGIVAAEAALGVFAECCADGAFGEDSRAAREQAAMAGDANPWAEPEPAAGATAPPERGGGDPQPFPRLLGVLAFDTPYLGIAPGVVRYGAEEHYREGKKWYDGASALLGPGSTPASIFNRAGASASAPSSAPAIASAAAAEQSAGGGGWSWGRAALVAGAGIGAGAAALAAGYAGRNYIAGGYTWATEHLAFVGCLAREAELKERVRRLAALSEGRYTTAAGGAGGDVRVGGVGFANLYTLLDPAATRLPDQAGATRTFCRLPPEGDAAADKFVAATNAKASGEVQAHVTMFEPAENPQYEGLVSMSAALTRRWVEEWAARPV